MSTPSARYASIQDEFETSLRKAFQNQPASTYIFYDNRRQVFQAEAIAYGMAKGWLDGRLNEIEEQYSRFEARLTDKGRAELLA